MSDTAEAQAPTTDDPETGQSDPPPSTDASGLKKALESERAARRDAERRAKELEPYAEKARQAEEASKTEQQRLAEALEAERTGKTTAESKLLRYEVAAEKGLPLTLVRFLHGGTKDEVGEAADALLKELQTKPAMPTRPTERLATGAVSSTDDSEDPLVLIAKARGEKYP